MKKNELKNEVKNRVIADYVSTNFKVGEIAKRHNISVPKLSALVREAGVPRRPRGSRRLRRPSQRAQEILSYAGAHGFSEAGRHFNTSRQFVSSLGKRWGVQSPKPRATSRCADEGIALKKRGRKARREVVVCFRLKKDEMSLLRAVLPPSVTQSVSSVHKLARAAILERIEKQEIYENLCKI